MVININLLSNNYIYITNVYNKCKDINQDMVIYWVRVGRLRKHNKNKK